MCYLVYGLVHITYLLSRIKYIYKQTDNTIQPAEELNLAPNFI